MRSVCKMTIVATMVAVLALSTGCDSESGGVTQSPSDVGSSVRSTKPSAVVEGEGALVKILPLLKQNGIDRVFVGNTNKYYVLFPLDMKEGVPGCGFVMVGTGVSLNAQSRIEGDVVQFNFENARVILQLTSFPEGYIAGAGQRRVGDPLEVRLDEVTLDLLEKKSDPSVCS